MTALRLEPKVWGALTLVVVAGAIMLIGLPGPQAKLDERAVEFRTVLESRERHIDPGEMQDLLNNNQLELHVLDTRDEAEFNLFHLIDARRIALDDLDEDWLKGLRPTAIKVVMSNDEERAEQAWEALNARGVAGVYILAGGINLWLDIFKDHRPGPAHDAIRGEGNDRLRHRFDYASGHTHPASDPRPNHAPKRSYPEKVKVAGPQKLEGGGCG